MKLNRLKDVSGKNYEFDHNVEIVWTEGTSEEKKAELLEGYTEDELKDVYKTSYQLMRLEFLEDGTYKFKCVINDKQYGDSNVVGYWTQSTDYKIVNIWGNEEHTGRVTKLEFINDRLCMDAVASTDDEVRKLYMKIYLIFKQVE